MSDTRFVLDIGTTKVVCLAARRGQDERMRVESVANVACSGVRKGVVEDIESVAESIDSAVHRVEQDLGVNVEMVTVGIGGAHIESQNAQGFLPISPPGRQVRREDVLQVVNHSRQLVMPPDREQMQAIPREFRIDGQRGITRPIGLPGSKLEVVTHVITGKSAHLQAIEKALGIKGRRIEQVVVHPLASGLAVIGREGMERGCLVIDMGAGTTDVAIFSNGTITYTASMPVGGWHVTNDIAQLLRVSEEEAERLKLSYGHAIAAYIPEEDVVDIHQDGSDTPRPMKRRVLGEIIESRIREIANMVRQHLYRSGCEGLADGIVLTGGGSSLKGIDEQFAAVLDPLKAKCGKLKPNGPAARQVESPALATAVGLAQFALDSDEHEFAPVSGFASWKDRFHAIKSHFSGKPRV